MSEVLFGMRNFHRIICALCLTCSSFIISAEPLPAQETTGTEAAPRTPLSVEQIVKNLEEKNRERAASLCEFKGTRIYRMQYHGILVSRDAEMTVNVTYKSPNTKEFTVVSTNGSKFLIDHVLKKLLQGEQEAANDENPRRTALDSKNYDFTLLEIEPSPRGPQYVLNVDPKSNNKFLYRGKIWVDAKDFAVTRIEGEPAAGGESFRKLHPFGWEGDPFDRVQGLPRHSGGCGAQKFIRHATYRKRALFASANWKINVAFSTPISRFVG
jgi:outer membrane lipoprotein-sorting protein